MLGGGVDRVSGCSAAVSGAAAGVAITVPVPISAAAFALAVALAAVLAIALGLDVVLAAGFRVGSLAAVRGGLGAFGSLLQGSMDLLAPIDGVQAAGDDCLGGRACSRSRERRQCETRKHLDA